MRSHFISVSFLMNPNVRKTWMDVCRLSGLSSPVVRRGSDICDNSMAAASPRLGLEYVEPEQVRVTWGFARRLTTARSARGPGFDTVSRRGSRRGALRLGRQFASPKPPCCCSRHHRRELLQRLQLVSFATASRGDKRKLMPTASRPRSSMQNHTATMEIGVPISAPRFPRARRIHLSASFPVPTRPT